MSGIGWGCKDANLLHAPIPDPSISGNYPFGIATTIFNLNRSLMSTNIFRMDDYRKSPVLQPAIAEIQALEKLQASTTLQLRSELQFLANLYPKLAGFLNDDAQILIDVLNDKSVSVETLKNIKKNSVSSIKAYEELTGIKILPSYLS